MKPTRLIPILLCCSSLLAAQELPVKTAMLFKNGRALLFKAGAVASPKGVYSTGTLPDALFGTYWVSAPGDAVQSVFVVQDSMDTSKPCPTLIDVLQQNIGKNVRLTTTSPAGKAEVLEGRIEKLVLQSGGNDAIVLRRQNSWVTVEAGRIAQLSFKEKPDRMQAEKEVKERLEVRFKTPKDSQEMGLSYLTGKIGWIPVYRLELLEKKQGRLALRAEMINDGEDLGSAEIRLAASVPAFAGASERSALLKFEKESNYALEGPNSSLYSMGNFLSMENIQLASYSPVSYNTVAGDENEAFGQTATNFEGSQLEDIYFYKVNPGDFPKGSRYQYPVFEEEVQLEHFYECTLESASAYYAASGGYKAQDNYPVYHYVEFDNKTKYPWTKGLVSILAKPEAKAISADKILDQTLVKFRADLEPLSQDNLDYTPVSGSCKVRISTTPDVLVRHIEGTVDRTFKVKKILNREYDLVKIEGQVALVNRGSETILLKLRRSIEGAPVDSEQPWEKTQEEATLQINPAYIVCWELELKPGEEKNWNYRYETFVRN